MRNKYCLPLFGAGWTSRQFPFIAKQDVEIAHVHCVGVGVQAPSSIIYCVNLFDRYSKATMWLLKVYCNEILDEDRHSVVERRQKKSLAA
jgi:hypothetical protein